MNTDRSKIDPARMHAPDQHLVDVVLAYVTERLALTEAPIDGFGDRDEMQQALGGLIGPEPKDPVAVLSIYEKYLSETVLSAESPHFFGFIPAAPTKAALLFDMVVSVASLQGCSWLEAAGAVMAENQALRTMADIAQMPQGQAAHLSRAAAQGISQPWSSHEILREQNA